MWFEWWMWFSDLIWMWFGSLGHCDVCTQILHVQMYWQRRRVYQKNYSSRVTGVWEWNIMIVTVDKFGLESWGLVLFCSSAVLDPRVGYTMDILSPFISVLWLFHVLMLSIQAVRGLPRLRASDIVPCIVPHGVTIVCLLPCFDGV